MGSVRDAYGNRFCEIYFATLEWDSCSTGCGSPPGFEARKAIVSISIEG